MMLRSTLGVVTLVVGLVGLFIPLIPGIPLLIISWLLLRRGDHHWRDRSLRLRHSEHDDLGFVDKVQLRTLQGTAHVLGHLERLEARVLGRESSRLPPRR